MRYKIEITKQTETKGLLSFVDGPVAVRATCWFKASTPIAAGTTYSAAATVMAAKLDSVTGQKRPGIFIKEFGDRGIFIHEGKDVSWSDNCVVLPRNEMMSIWNHIVDQGDKEEYVIEIAVT